MDDEKGSSINKMHDLVALAREMEEDYGNEFDLQDDDPDFNHDLLNYRQ